MKKFLLIFYFLFILNSSVFATNKDLINESIDENIENITDIDYTINIDEELDKQFKQQVIINTEFVIDLTEVLEKLKIIYPDSEFEFKWDLYGASLQSGPKFFRIFKEKGEKELELTIFETKKDNDNIDTKKTIFNKKLNFLVFEKSLPLIFSSEINLNSIDDYINFSKKDGIFVYKIGPLDKNDIELTNIINSIEKYEKIGGLKSDYIIVWGGRDFIFNILSKINRELILLQEDTKKYNIVSISPYNINILKNYLSNFLANKSWLNKMILLNERSKFIILKQNLINDLIKELEDNKHEFIDVNLKESKVSSIFFISKFINNLSNLGYSTNSIYIFLIIPIILTFISIFKHFIGLSPIGVIIPLFLTLLFFKLGLFLTIFLIIFYLILNLGLSVIISRFNILYTPKINFILIINIVVFIIVLNIGYSLKLINLDLTDILYFLLFIIISEKFINIIISKDLLEYKENFFYTFFIALFCYFILNINTVKVFTLAYPELILIAIPINFLIGKFSGLRIVEYFRFKEVIKSVEE